MGLHKNIGNPAAALAEECSEVIQIISKFYRFPSATWEEIPPGKLLSRWDQLSEEMEDLLYQWQRLKMEQELKKVLTRDQFRDYMDSITY